MELLPGKEGKMQQHVEALTRRSFLVGAAGAAAWLATPVYATGQASSGTEQSKHRPQRRAQMRELSSPQAVRFCPSLETPS